MKQKIRIFGKDSGSRDTEDGKLDFEGFVSPLVMQAYGEYMHKHRKMVDGSLRESDNWQKFFGPNHLSVCMKSMWRHFMDLWMFHRGHIGRETIDDAINGIMFNVMAYYHYILVKRLDNNKKHGVVKIDW